VKYSLYVGECLTIIWAIFFFQCYVYGNPFILVLNHQPRKFLMELDWFTSKFAKWAFILQEYTFDIIQKVGKVNWDADGFNWNPSFSEEDTTSARWHGKVDLEAMLGWHVLAYMCILLGFLGDVP
jgi:hypothetical protein